MSRLQGRRSRAAMLAAVISAASLSPALGDAADYEFQLVESVAKVGEAVVAVRLVDTRTSKPVPDAVIYATRIDMAPDGMPTMSSAIASTPSDQLGVYRFKTKLTMEGGWRLSLAAKVQGETGTVEGKLVLQAKP
ncbi:MULTISPECIES: FixH family protein [Hansschlegelia]|uniref:Heavy metal RND transporter n=1 Tax=Hansschlegelia zhihuaiae TaxID=405005 RepID=A0A4V1KIQ2_9HYPH|nr:FixH family protein [Hansschlegelia zhihuaiae]RXF71482.1 heavy metal RND transporter [Hansschlegelia zhihuaiae]